MRTAPQTRRKLARPPAIPDTTSTVQARPLPPTGPGHDSPTRAAAKAAGSDRARGIDGEAAAARPSAATCPKVHVPEPDGYQSGPTVASPPPPATRPQFAWSRADRPENRRRTAARSTTQWGHGAVRIGSQSRAHVVTWLYGAGYLVPRAAVPAGTRTHPLAGAHLASHHEPGPVPAPPPQPAPRRTRGHRPRTHPARRASIRVPTAMAELVEFDAVTSAAGARCAEGDHFRRSRSSWSLPSSYDP